MEVLREEVLASQQLETYFHQLIKEKGGLSVEDIREIMADYVMKHSSAESLVDELDLEHIRICSQCGKPMYEGYFIEDGAEYNVGDSIMEGPARGLWKEVCNKRPAVARPAPASIAVRAVGSLEPMMM